MWKKFKLEGKLPNKSKLLVILLVGLLLLVISLPTSDKKSVSKEDSQELQTGNDSYESVLEKRLETVLSKVKGVGKIDVMITLETNGEKVVEKDLQMDTQNIQEEDSAGGSRLTKEQGTINNSVYTQSADGSQMPYVSKELTPEVAGVVVIAEGGDDPVIVQDITEAVQALFHLEAHKIKIMKRNDS